MLFAARDTRNLRSNELTCDDGRDKLGTEDTGAESSCISGTIVPLKIIIELATVGAMSTLFKYKPCLYTCREFLLGLFEVTDHHEGDFVLRCCSFLVFVCTSRVYAVPQHVRCYVNDGPFKPGFG